MCPTPRKEGMVVGQRFNSLTFVHSLERKVWWLGDVSSPSRSLYLLAVTLRPSWSRAPDRGRGHEPCPKPWVLPPPVASHLQRPCRLGSEGVILWRDLGNIMSWYVLSQCLVLNLCFKYTNFQFINIQFLPLNIFFLKFPCKIIAMLS